MLDLEEQEKIDILKAWWKQYASWVWAFVLVLAVSYASMQVCHITNGVKPKKLVSCLMLCALQRVAVMRQQHYNRPKLYKKRNQPAPWPHGLH